MSDDQTRTGVDGTLDGALEEGRDDALDESVDERAEDERAATEPEPTADHAPGAALRALHWCRRRWVNLLLVVGVLVSAGAAGGVYWGLYRPDQLTDAAARAQVTEAAKQATVALLSYAPDTIDEDLANGKSHLTGEFLKYYSEFTEKYVAPASRQRGVKTQATVVRAAVSDMRPGRAVVLAFINQVTSSKDRPEPTQASSSVLVTMVKDGGQWLISEFNPV